MDRDYKDLENPDLAVYNFRGYTVLRFYKGKKELEFGDDANMCRFIPDDYSGMAEFLLECKRFIEGEVEDVASVGVN